MKNLKMMTRCLISISKVPNTITKLVKYKLNCIEDENECLKLKFEQENAENPFDIC